MAPTPFLAVLLWPALWRDAHLALQFALVSCAFGATAAMHLPSGSPILLSVVAAVPLFWHAARTPSRGSNGPGVALLLLLALLAWAALLTAFAPRLLGDGVRVIGLVNRGAYPVADLVPLAPHAGNFNQSAYLVFNVAVFWALGRLLGQSITWQQVANGLLTVSAVNLALVGLQAAHLYAGLPNALDPFVNAGYAIHVGGNIGGLTRLSGAFPEASSFSGFTLALHAVCGALFRAGYRPWWSGGMSLGLLAVLLLSTSSTAYVGLAMLHGTYALWLLASWLRAPRDIHVGSGAAVALVGASLLIAALLCFPAIQDVLTGVLSKALFNKLDSASGLERSFWNGTAWRTFIDSMGWGVGVGGTRASSFPLVLLSNLGAIGTLLFVAFVGVTAGAAFTARHAPSASHAAAHGMLAMLAGATVSATVLDLGVLFYILTAVAFHAAARPVPGIVNPAPIAWHGSHLPDHTPRPDGASHGR